jgi:hypothetical protein
VWQGREIHHFSLSKKRSRFQLHVPLFISAHLQPGRGNQIRLLCRCATLMQIITLTSDLGNRDYYTGVAKGALLSAVPGATLVDLSHEVEPFNILHAAFILKNSYEAFPPGAIHLVAVNSFHDRATAPLLIQHDNYFFIGPDNGLFGLIWNEKIPEEIYRLTLTEEEKISTHPLSGVYVRIAKAVAEKKTPSSLGEKIARYRVKTMGQAAVNEDFIRGNIIYFDRFGNAVANILSADFNRLLKGRKFNVIFKRYSDLDALSASYSSVDESEKLCFFNSRGYLEIAINKGNARQLLNLNTGDIVQIEFHGR